MHRLLVILGYLYEGTMRNLAPHKNVTHDKCEGQDAKRQQESDVATVCGRYWNGVVQQIQSVCMDCQGRADEISSNVIDTEAQ